MELNNSVEVHPSALIWEAITAEEVPHLSPGDTLRETQHAAGITRTREGVLQEVREGGVWVVEGGGWIGGYSSAKYQVKRKRQEPPTADMIYAKWIGDWLYTGDGEGWLMVRLPAPEGHGYLLVDDSEQEAYWFVVADKITRWVEAEAVAK